MKRSKKKNDEKIFAKGLCGKKLFIIYIIGSIFGCYYEQILNLIKHYLSDGSIFWEVRQGVIYGPFSPVYGFGALMMIWILLRKKKNNYQLFLYGALIGGGVEFLISYLQEVFVGTTSWNYSSHFLNFGGRTSVPIMLIWGFLAIILAKVVYPFVSNLIEKIPYNIGNIIYYTVAVLLCFDMFISWSALLRQTLRRNGYEPFTPLGTFYDEVYPDDVLARYFPNMVVKK